MDMPIIKDIVKWLSLRNRVATLEGWLKNERLGFDRRLTAGASGITNTGRLRHSVVVNVPKAEDSVQYGKEMRDLFIPSAGNVFVNYDAAALESRVAAHYTWKYDNGDFAKELLEGDIHSKNCKVFFPDETSSFDINSPEFSKDDPLFKPWRSKSKNGFYCVPMDTRALTRKGWKGYHEIEVGDEVLGYDTESQTKKWTKVTHKHYTEDKEVIEVRNKWWGVRATGDHRWCVLQRKAYATGNQDYSMNNVVAEFRSTDDLNTMSNILVNAPMDEGQDNQSLGESEILMRKFDYDWTQRVLNMSRTERLAFLEGFLIADGYLSVKDGKWTWGQNDNELAEAALTASYLVHGGMLHVQKRLDSPKPMKIVKLSKKRHVTCQKMKKTSLGVQPTWCITTELGTWVMRQADIITITGNCAVYGGGPGKMASTLGQKATRGKELFDAFWESNYSLKMLRENLEKFWEYQGGKKFIIGLDGRKIFTRNPNGVLNCLFQSAGAILMDLSTAFMDKWLGGLVMDSSGYLCYNVKGHTVKRVTYHHDDLGWDCPPEVADYVGELGVKSIREAGKYFKLNVELDGEYKKGASWRYTH
jgi:hypothetical protein